VLKTNGRRAPLASEQKLRLLVLEGLYFIGIR
jgi:hypothetical protein